MSRINIAFLVAFVGALVWIFLLSPNSLDRIQRGALSTFRPTIEASTELEEAIENFGDQKYTKTDLRKMLTDAELQRDKLQLEVLKLDESLEENNALRSALNYVKNAPLKLVPAQVIARKPSTWYNTLIIDKGALDKIETDSPVIVPVGDYAGLVGKVSEVRNDNTAVIILLTDEMCQVSARIEGTADQGIIAGQRGSLKIQPNLSLPLEFAPELKDAFQAQPDLLLKYLPKIAASTKDRNIISSGAGDLFPENLLLGKVIDFKLGAIDAEAIVKPAVDFSKLKNVFVVLPEKSKEELEKESEQESSSDSEVPQVSNSSVETTQVSSRE